MAYQQQYHQQQYQQQYQQPPQQPYSSSSSQQDNSNNNNNNNSNNSNSFYDDKTMLRLGSLGFNTGTELLKGQREKWTPGATKLWDNLKILFKVSNTSVVRKMKILLIPFQHKNWGRLRDEDAHDSKYASPRDDPNAPDLYIPLMSFITYMLLVGLCKGLGSSGFIPEMLGNSIWNCFVVQMFECVIIKVALSTTSATSISFVDIVSYTGYKYFGLAIHTFFRMLGTYVSILVGIYITVASFFFILKAIAAVVPHQSNSGPPRHLIILCIALTQVFLNGWYAFSSFR
jgi:hypothetical protein